jgi:UDP-2-acetamido-3-amino-2,3-dideoxy-glucuronate N-acetyltransferase
MSELETLVHPTAVVDPGAEVGPGTRVWHFTHVMAGARIGAGCVLGQNVFVAGSVVIGPRCRIQNNVSLYDGVILEPDVFVGPSAVFTNVSRPRAAFPRRYRFERTLVEEGATIGANATIRSGLVIGRCALVGAGAVVTRSVPRYALVAGIPARAVGHACRCGERPGADLLCPSCGRRYRRAGEGLEEIA